jgi:hypothetical protein
MSTTISESWTGGSVDRATAANGSSPGVVASNAAADVFDVMLADARSYTFTIGAGEHFTVDAVSIGGAGASLSLGGTSSPKVVAVSPTAARSILIRSPVLTAAA